MTAFPIGTGPIGAGRIGAGPSGAGPISAGLCSVTFRQLGIEEIVSLAVRAGLAGIEWGADRHLPPGDTRSAALAKSACDEAGLQTETYGSYVYCDGPGQDGFDAVLDTAAQLGAKRVRTWAGRKGSREATPGDRRRTADMLERHCEAASARGIEVALEFHPGTLTDTATSTLELLRQVGHPALGTYWQPTDNTDTGRALGELETLGPWLRDLHIFNWNRAKARFPLQQGRAFWMPILAAVAASGPRWGFLEFVRNDDPEQFIRDASALADMLADIGSGDTAAA